MHVTLRYLVLFFFSLGLFITCGLTLVQIACHSWSLPECWHCGGKQVRQSAKRQGVDGAVRLLLMAPYRCRACQRRFYAFRTHRAATHSHV
jgi:hypothetical protein